MKIHIYNNFHLEVSHSMIPLEKIHLKRRTDHIISSTLNGAQSPNQKQIVKDCKSRNFRKYDGYMTLQRHRTSNLLIRSIEV